jgi:hypothetical protein
MRSITFTHAKSRIGRQWGSALFGIVFLQAATTTLAQQTLQLEATPVQRCVAAAQSACRLAIDDLMPVLLTACRASPDICSNSRQVLQQAQNACRIHAQATCSEQFQPATPASAPKQ